jgi:hypothetical protein
METYRKIATDLTLSEEERYNKLIEAQEFYNERVRFYTDEYDKALTDN